MSDLKINAKKLSNRKKSIKDIGYKAVEGYYETAQFVLMDIL